MASNRESAPSLPPDQEAFRARCYHPTGTFSEFPEADIESSVPACFEAQARQYPQNLAVKVGDKELTYAQLNETANRIAHAVLNTQGGDSTQVGLLAHQSPAAVAAALAILKAGHTYVPLDPFAPESRNQQIAADAQIALLITDDELNSAANQLAPASCSILNFDRLDQRIASDNLGVFIEPDRNCYIMYTSGSTGKPKGVIQNHRNVLFKSQSWINLVHICPADRLSLLRSLSVSGCIRDLFGGLLAGAAVLVFDVKRNGTALLSQWLAREKITVYNSVATLLRNIDETFTDQEDLSNIRLVKISGEPIYRRDVEIYRKYFPQDALLINMLASAEAGSVRVYFMDHQSELPDNIVPVGYPLAGCDVLLLDRNYEQVGDHEVGEIAVRSHYLSTGYWQQPEQTVTAFVIRPETDERVFLTGDLGLMLSDGCLIHKGRKDSHVKIRGYSVECGEVEAILSAIAGVKQAVVTVKPNKSGEQALVAYVVLDEIESPTASQLRHGIAGKLPDYMVPSAFVVVSDLPLTGPGKVNLQALPPPCWTRPDLETPLVLPQTPIETAIAQIWCEVLGLQSIGIHDNFLDLGGDSLKASQIISRVINRYRVELSATQFFNTATIAAMADLLVNRLIHDIAHTPD